MLSPAPVHDCISEGSTDVDSISLAKVPITDSISSAKAPTVVTANASTDRISFPSFLIKREEKKKSHQRNLEGEKVLKELLSMAKAAGYDNTFKHKMKGKWISKVHLTAFAADGNLNR